jgi:alginate O-acetyltransferase complex protein AlgJ
VEIALVGSSFTYPAYGFQDALRYTLQRNFLAVSKPEQGPWAGMLEYLNSEAFKKNPPKLIVWEVSEVTLGNPPDSPWRDPRYQMSGDEWLARMKTMLQQ